MEKQKKQKTKIINFSNSLEEVLANPSLVQDGQNLVFFLESTSESIRKTTTLIQQLESEVARLKYEVMATENEYKNLRQLAEDAFLRWIKKAFYV